MFWLERFARLVGSIRIATTIGGGYFDTGIIRRKQIQVTLLVNVMTHTTLTQSNLSVSSAVVKPSFSGGSKLARESFATLASAKQKTVHCSGLLARKISDKNADMDHHAVPPPEYQAGGDSRRENLCQQDSARVNKTTPRASSSGQLDATEDPAVENKVHLHPNTAGDKYSKKFDDPAKNFKPQNEEEHEIYNQVLNSFCASVVN